MANIQNAPFQHAGVARGHAAAFFCPREVGLFVYLFILHKSADDLSNTLFNSSIGKSCCGVCLRGGGCECNGLPICLV